MKYKSGTVIVDRLTKVRYVIVKSFYDYDLITNKKQRVYKILRQDLYDSIFRCFYNYDINMFINMFTINETVLKSKYIIIYNRLMETE